MGDEARGIDRAIAAAGSQVELAGRLGVSQQSVSEWKQQGWVPTKRAIEIEAQYGIPRATLVNPRLLDLLDVSGD